MTTPLDYQQYAEMVKRLQEWAKAMTTFLNGGLVGPAPVLQIPPARDTMAEWVDDMGKRQT